MAWDKVPEELVKKAWDVSHYRRYADLCGESNTGSMVEYSDEQLGTIVEKIAGDAARMAWIDEANEPDDPFPEEDNNVDWDMDDDERAVQENAQRRKRASNNVSPEGSAEHKEQRANASNKRSARKSGSTAKAKAVITRVSIHTMS